MRLISVAVYLVAVAVIGSSGFFRAALAQSTVIAKVGHTINLKSPDGKFAALCKETELKVIETKSGREIISFKLDSPITYNSGCCWNPDSSKLVVGTNSDINVFDTKKKKQTLKFNLYPPTKSCCFSPNGQFFSSFGSTLKSKRFPDCLKVWEIDSGTEIFSMNRKFGSRLVWSSDSNKIAVIDTDWNVLAIDLESKVVVATIKAVPRGYPALSWSPDGRYLAVAELSGLIELYDTTDSSFVNSFKSRQIHRLHWMRDGKQIEITHDWNGKDKSRWTIPFDNNTGEIERGKKVVLIVGMKGYIPKDLEECFKQLDAELGRKTIETIEASKEKEMSRLHHGLGTWLRNYWGLWSGSRLAKYFNKLNIQHPDDMSGIVINSYWRYKHSMPLNVDEQIQRYKSYWERAKKAQAKENRRVKESKQKIEAMMMNLESVNNKFQTLTLNQRKSRGIAVRDVATYNNMVFITSKRNQVDDKFSLACFLLDLNSEKIKQIQLEGVSRIDGGVVWRKRLYILGYRDSEKILFEIADDKRREFKIPNVKGWSILGVGQGKLLLVQTRAVYSFSETGTWSKYFDSEVDMPKCARTPLLANNRLYFRNQGVGGDNKSLSWIDPNNPKYLTALTKDTRVVGPSGPRWENVFSFRPCSDSCLWLTAGSSFPSVIKWNKKLGYRVAVFNSKLKFDGNLIGPSYMSDPPSDNFSITCVAPESKHKTYCAGPSGLFVIENRKIKTLVRFKNTTQTVNGLIVNLHWNWRPNNLVRLNKQKYFISGHWGGCYLLERKAGNWSIKSVDEDIKDVVQL